MGYRNITADQLTFGIEIEGLLPADIVSREGIEVGHYHRGIQIPGLPTGWKAEADCSIDSSYAFVCLEIVSPILRGANGLQQLVEVCQQLRRWGWKMNKSCGCHIHVGTSALRADDLTGDAKEKISHRALASANGMPSRIPPARAGSFAA